MLRPGTATTGRSGGKCGTYPAETPIVRQRNVRLLREELALRPDAWAVTMGTVVKRSSTGQIERHFSCDKLVASGHFERDSLQIFEQERDGSKV